METEFTKSVWVAFTLHEFVELSRNAPQVERELRQHFGEDSEIFIPVQVQNVSSRDFCVNLFDGYAFVKHTGSQDFDRLARKMRGSYVERVLKSSGKVSYVQGSEIEKYRSKLKGMVYSFVPGVGDLVEGVEGTFKSMIGMVTRVDVVKKTADVRFKTRTREVLAKDLSFIAIALKEDI